MNYSKISGQNVCKMAMFFAFMLAACSEDNSLMNEAHGGSTEETNVYALAGRVGDVYPKVMRLQGLDLSSQNGEGRSDVDQGTVVVVSELDSLTLEKTGRSFVDTIDNNDGDFSIENIALGSPYALIEIQDSCIAADCKEWGVWGSNDYPTSVEVPCDYDELLAMDSTWAAALPDHCGVLDSTKYPIPLSGIVDVRKYQGTRAAKLNINTLSYLKIPLLKKYYAEGMSFEEAGRKAEREILESFGVYEDLGDFENAENVKGELSYVLQMMIHITRSGILFDAVLPINVEYYYGMSPTLLASLGEKAEQLYSNTVKFLDYEIGYFAHKKGIEQCTSSRENETFTVDGLGVGTFVCHSDKWVAGAKKIDYTSGSMTDARDGKTYKTVTYDWNGVKQTWMAENLNYADTVSGADTAMKKRLLGNTKCWESDPSCELFGRYYTWRSAMNIEPSSINLVSVVLNEVFDEAIERYVSSYDTVTVESMCMSGDRDTAVEYCSAKTTTGTCRYLDTAASVYEYCENKYYQGCRFVSAEYLPSAGAVAHQGVCPEGWRIPNKSDWDVLFENIASRGASFKDADGSGFGYLEAMTVNFENSATPLLRVGEREYTRVAFASVPESAAEFNENAPIAFWPFIGFPPSSAKDVYGNLSFAFTDTKVRVRCIKD